MSKGILLKRLYNTPIAITQGKLDVILQVYDNYLEDKDARTGLIESDIFDDDNEEVFSQTKEGVFVINVSGTLVNSNGVGASGITSYERLTSETLSAVQNGASKLLYNVSSPGGEIKGLFPFVSLIASLPEKYGIETIGYTKDTAASAAFCIYSACSTTYATPTSELGSIGVVMSIKGKGKEGDEDNNYYFRSRNKKQRGAQSFGISEEDLAHFQQEVDYLGKYLDNTVMGNSPKITQKMLDSLDGDTVFAEQGLDRDLKLFDILISNQTELPIYEEKPMTTQDGQGSPEDQVKIEATLTSKDVEAAVKEALANDKASREAEAAALAAEEQKEKDRVAAIEKSGEALSIRQEIIASQITAKVSAETAKGLFTTIAELNGSTSDDLISGVSGTNAPEGERSVLYKGENVNTKDILSVPTGE